MTRKRYFMRRCGGWRPGGEPRFKIAGRKLVFHLALVEELEADYSPANIVAVGVNEDNFTLAVYRDGKRQEGPPASTNPSRLQRPMPQARIQAAPPGDSSPSGASATKTLVLSRRRNKLFKKLRRP